VRLGRRLADVLSLSWRKAPPPLAVTGDELADLEPRLIASGAWGLVAWRVRGSALEKTPAGQRLLNLYRHQVMANALRETKIAEVFRTLHAAGVEPLLGKGWAIARSYPETGLRPSGDIDLYVRRAEHPRARAVLSGEARHVVDLHEGIAELDDRDEAGVFERARLVTVAATPVRILSPEDHLRLVTLHALRHGLIRPLWLCDVAVLLETLPGNFGWADFLAGSPARTGWAVAALHLAGTLLGASQAAVPGEWRVREQPAWLAPAVLAEWGAGRIPQGMRAPMLRALGRPRAFVHGLFLRWPNPVEATVGLGLSLGTWPPVPAQLAECARRAGLFGARLAHHLVLAKKR